jgi:hypothetical protein
VRPEQGEVTYVVDDLASGSIVFGQDGLVEAVIFVAVWKEAVSDAVCTHANQR